MRNQSTKQQLTIERTSTGRLAAVNVPIVTSDDKADYQLAAQSAGFTTADIYRVRAEDFLTRGASNAKVLKSDKRNKARKRGKRYLSCILHLSPHKLSGFNVCPQAHGCAMVCVNYNGKGQLENGAFEHADSSKRRWLIGNISHCLRHSVHAARIAKTRLLYLAPELWAELFAQDMERFSAYAAHRGFHVSCRSNGTSDIAFETMRFARFGNRTIYEAYPATDYYDYTKLFLRARRAATDSNWPANYDLTFSRDETNDKQAHRVLELGGRVALVVRSHAMRKLWGGPLAHAGNKLLRRLVRTQQLAGYSGYRLVNADAHDERQRDPKPSVCLLYAKGRAARDSSGFAVECA